MTRFRVFLVSTLGGLAGALVVLGISSYFEQHEWQRAVERMRTAPPPLPQGAGSYGAVWGAGYGPGLFTVYLSIMIFAAIFFILLKWQQRDA